MAWNERVLGEPSAADLAAIEAKLALLDTEIRVLCAADRLSPLDWRRTRRAVRRVLTARLRAVPRPGEPVAGVA